MKYVLACMELQDPHPVYNLFGCIVHSGLSSESGHYYAYVKDDAIDQWFCCNDSHVSLSSSQNVLSEKACRVSYSELRMSVWTDDVYSFMRSQKRRRIQSSDISQDFDAMRKQLVSDAARVCRSKVPESLMENLIKRLEIIL
ncbi:Ubiquitin carboxyl-terminal hydrolase 25 [Zea mays]|uniref:ubiquitinyl hydrolase 1 n=2 Tax=Zea mays TaxID=4577 RepID=A0A3L6D7F4_MAIZE|nr:hypothetical protein Zm00014a_038410 [Zea mays]PWZ04073.1 Ubiquitin carboxyl-terminal hydrolase 25 [Zea mays]